MDGSHCLANNEDLSMVPSAVRLTSLKTGEAVDLCSMAVACDFLRRSGHYLHWKIYGDKTNIVSNPDGEEFKLEIIGAGRRRDTTEKTEADRMRRLRHQADPRFRSQLCQDCARAVGFCSWSSNLTPVEGWEAEGTTIKATSKNTAFKSYHISACPLFIRDADTKEGRRIQRNMLLEERRQRHELQGIDTVSEADSGNIRAGEQDA